ncbi:DMT family transporter [Bacillus sp. B1-b2]|uniref:DMT family transporter n=1 Tax=Bacillus sp. B1-b2 TaxID=2653201 RepID=UPI001261B10D|nr:DMT family transporter [Bacillus sp. B1-b2]KAB7668967.1 DMT family transporter [Bacillus sp. B1-b2]
MKGIVFAFLGGAFITLQGVANATISQDIGTWQAATITQFTGFVLAFLILLIVREKAFAHYKEVKPLYLAGGSFASIVIFCSITAIHLVGATLTTSTVLIAQLFITFLIDSNGWFGLEKQKMKAPQFIGIALMIAGVLLLKM